MHLCLLPPAVSIAVKIDAGHSAGIGDAGFNVGGIIAGCEFMMKRLRRGTGCDNKKEEREKIGWFQF